MRLRVIALILAFLCSVLTGCSTLGLDNALPMSAAPLKSVNAACVDEAIGSSQSAGEKTPAPVPSSTCTNIDKVNDLVQDSLTKCNDFISLMFARVAATNSTLDITSTILSAIASITTPLSTAHILTAGSTVAGAAKTTIDSQYLNTLTMSHITQAVGSTYSLHMAQYIASLDSVKDVGAINVYAERSKILNIHVLCSLPVAEASINSTLQTTGTAPQTASKLSVTYKDGKDGETAAETAKGISDKINADKGLQDAGVTATVNGAVVSLASKNKFTWGPATFTPNKANASVQTASFDNSVNPPTLTIGGSGNSGDTIVITATPAETRQPNASAPPKGELTVTYIVASDGETAVATAKGISDKINNDQSFKNAGVTANSKNNVITLSSTRDKLTWKHPVSFAPKSASNVQSAVFDSAGDSPTLVTTLTIGGSGHKGDTVTLSATPAPQQQPSDAATLPPSPPLVVRQAPIPVGGQRIL